jgi:hypothetical protein
MYIFGLTNGSRFSENIFTDTMYIFGSTNRLDFFENDFTALKKEIGGGGLGMSSYYRPGGCGANRCARSKGNDRCRYQKDRMTRKRGGWKFVKLKIRTTCEE